MYRPECFLLHNVCRRGRNWRFEFKSRTATWHHDDIPICKVTQSIMQKERLLFLGSNPENTERIRIDRELKLIKASIARARLSNKIDLIAEFAATIQDARSLLLRYRPKYLHFSGHGTAEGIIFEDDRGHAQIAPMHAFSDMLAAGLPQLYSVVLNCCHSAQQAKMIASRINYVVGISASISDQSATTFSPGYYEALFNGKTPEQAFGVGRNALELQSQEGANFIWLFKSPDATQAAGERMRHLSAPSAYTQGSELPLIVGSFEGLNPVIDHTKDTGLTVHGNQNVIIQNVSDSTLPVSIDGLGHQASENLSDNDARIDLEGEKNHQTELHGLNAEQRAFVLGKVPLNQWLTRKVIESLAAYSPDAQRFWDRVSERPNWEKQGNRADIAKQIIAYSFVGVIGVQLSKLMAIGKEKPSAIKHRKYLEKCSFIACSCLELICFALISRLWDQVANIQLTHAERKIILSRLDIQFQFGLPDLAKLFEILSDVYARHESHIELPFPELRNINEQLSSGTPLQIAIQQLQMIAEGTSDTNAQLLQCFEAERHLAEFLSQFAILGGYRMASIRQIGYKHIRNIEPCYIHRFTALGIDSKAQVDTEKINFQTETVHTDAVLLYKGEQYHEYINLFPFIIDYNALVQEHGAKVCFFQHQTFAQDGLLFRFWADLQEVVIERREDEGDYKYHERIRQEKNWKRLNLNCVVDQFTKARSAFAGDQDDE